MRTGIFAVLMMMAMAFPASASFVYNGHTYFLTTAATSATAAEAEATTFGGTLVAINDAAEQSFLVSTFGGSERLWIGFNDAVAEGSFVWSSGDAVTYTNWAGFEPNNAGGGEDYTVMNWTGAGNWNDCPNAGCGSAYRGIIEVASVPAPLSAALLMIGLFGLALRRKS